MGRQETNCSCNDLKIFKKKKSHKEKNEVFLYSEWNRARAAARGLGRGRRPQPGGSGPPSSRCPELVDRWSLEQAVAGVLSPLTRVGECSSRPKGLFLSANLVGSVGELWGGAGIMGPRLLRTLGAGAMLYLREEIGGGRGSGH